jgi:hypothetical protein
MLILVPRIGQGYHYCILSPGDVSALWPATAGLDAAVPLEVEPGWWVLPDDPWLGTYEQAWPTDVVRNCSRLGYEVSLASGIPLIGRVLLQPDERYFWHHLTLGLVHSSGDLGSLAEWSSLRDQLLRNLLPDSWHAPPSCGAIILVTEGDVMLMLSPSMNIWEAWVADQIRTHFHLGDLSESPRREALLEATRWLLREGTGQGVRVSHLTLRQTPLGTEVTVKGRWGRGRKTLIRAGKPHGEAFSQEWTLAPKLQG